MPTKDGDQTTLLRLLESNKASAARVEREARDLFAHSCDRQHLEYLWIGCRDSHVAANEIGAQPPGQVFVHRNTASVVVHSDLNCLSLIRYTVKVSRVNRIIVGCH